MNSNYNKVAIEFLTEIRNNRVTWTMYSLPDHV